MKRKAVAPTRHSVSFVVLRFSTRAGQNRALARVLQEDQVLPYMGCTLRGGEYGVAVPYSWALPYTKDKDFLGYFEDHSG